MNGLRKIFTKTQRRRRESSSFEIARPAGYKWAFWALTYSYRDLSRCE
jgi:hypothetical protein